MRKHSFLRILISLGVAVVFCLALSISAWAQDAGNEETMSRAMFVEVLYQLAGEPAASEPQPFVDIPIGSEYEPAIAWAAENGITAGVGNNRFAPDANVTREQMAVFFLHYAELTGTSPEGAWAIYLDYVDLAKISEWALEGVMFCKIHEFIPSENSLFAPKASVTLDEALVSFTLLIEYVDSAYDSELDEETIDEEEAADDEGADEDVDTDSDEEDDDSADEEE